MSNRRSFLSGLASLPLIGGDIALGQATAKSVLSAANDPFPAYHREIVNLMSAMGAASEEVAEQMMDRWGEIDRLAMTTRPTSLAGAAACLDYIRREYVQFKMHDSEETDDPTDRLFLSLIDGALGVLRPMGGADA